MIERHHLIGHIYWPEKYQFADEIKNAAYLYQITKRIWYFGVYQMYFGTAIKIDFQHFQDWQ